MIRRLAGILERVAPVAHPRAIVAHRGDSQNAPENTLASFRQAIELGCEAVELDVARSRDGHLLVFHDKKLDRTSTGSGRLEAHSLDEIREAEAGSWFTDHFEGEPIPTLGEVLDLCRGRTVPFIEIKQSYHPTDGVETPIVELLARRNMLEKAVVICRNEASVRHLARLAPTLPLSYIAFRKRTILGAAGRLPVRGLVLYHRWLGRGLVRELHRRRCFVAAWTVNEVGDMEACMDARVDALMTDVPRTLADLREKREVERLKRAIDGGSHGGRG